MIIGIHIFKTCKFEKQISLDSTGQWNPLCDPLVEKNNSIVKQVIVSNVPVFNLFTDFTDKNTIYIIPNLYHDIFTRYIDQDRHLMK